MSTSVTKKCRYLFRHLACHGLSQRLKPRRARPSWARHGVEAGLGGVESRKPPVEPPDVPAAYGSGKCGPHAKSLTGVILTKPSAYPFRPRR